MSVMGKNKKAMKCDRSFFAASLLLTLTVLIFLFTFVGEDLLCWIERHSGLASWVQAVGSISVILVMFYQVHKEIAEKRLERSMNEETMLFKTMLFLRRKHLLRSLNTLFCNYKKYKNNIFSEEGKFAYPAIFFIRITEDSVTSVYDNFQKITDDELEKYATLEIIRIRESINELNAVYSDASKKIINVGGFGVLGSNVDFSDEKYLYNKEINDQLSQSMVMIDYHINLIKSMSRKFIDLENSSFNDDVHNEN